MCKDCGTGLTQATHKKSTDFVDEEFLLCQKHYDTRFGVAGQKAKYKGPGGWRKSVDAGIASKKSIEDLATLEKEPAQEDPRESRRNSRSLFAGMGSTQPAEGVDNDFLEAYNASQVAAKKKSVTVTAPNEPTPAAKKAARKALLNDKNQIVVFSKDSGSGFIFELVNEEGVGLASDVDFSEQDEQSHHIFSSEIYEKVFLIADLTNDRPAEFAMRIRNERPFGVGVTLNFDDSVNLREKKRGALGTYKFSALGNGMTSDAAILVKVDESAEHEIAMSIQIQSRPLEARQVDYYVADDPDEEAAYAQSKEALNKLKDDDPAGSIGVTIDDTAPPRDPDYVDVTSVLSVLSANDRNLVQQTVDDLIKSEKVLLFSKQRCQYCMEVERVLVSLGVIYAVVDTNTLPAQSVVLDRLDTLGGIRTVPHLFVDGSSVGNCNQVKRYERTRELHIILAKYIDRERAKQYDEERVDSIRFMYYPETIDNHVTRVTGLLLFIYSIVCAGFYPDELSRWAVLALAVDNIFRYIGGPSASALGMIATFICARWKPRLVPGRPQQFAESMYSTLAVVAAGCYLARTNQLDIAIAGAVIIIVHGFFAVLEFVFNFNFAAALYNFAFKVRRVRQDVFRPHIQTLTEKKWEFAFLRDIRTFKSFHNTVKSQHVLLPGQIYESPVDLIRKNRLDVEFKLQDFSYTRHTTIDFYGCPLAIAMLAYVFKLTDSTVSNVKGVNSYHWGTKLVYEALCIISVVVFGIITIFYVHKAILYPKKVMKEWHHPIYGNFFQCVSTCLLIYGIMLLDFYMDFSFGLIWLAAMGQMVMSVLRMSNLVYDFHSEEMISPALLLGPIGNFFAAIAFGTCKFCSACISPPALTGLL